MSYDNDAKNRKSFLAVSLTFVALVFASTSLRAEPARKVEIRDLVYKGGFRLPLGTYGESSIAWSNGTFALSPGGDSIYVVGHVNDHAVAEFRIPELVNSQSLNELRMASAPMQGFTKVLSKATGGNPESLNTITGLFFYDGKLVVNAIDYYDGGADNRDTTLVIESPQNLASSRVSGFFELSCAATCSGWISKIPVEWQQTLGGTHIAGYASNYSIISRFSVGPSAFVIDPSELIAKTSAASSSVVDPVVKAFARMFFPLAHPLHPDIYNVSLQNELWTELSMAVYGFIVPGTSTYLTIGNSGGQYGGIGYKLSGCGGYCAQDSQDYYNYIWLWDVNDLVKVKSGLLQPYEIRPYAYGKLETPFQNGQHGLIMGADYDDRTKLLYLLLRGADGLQSKYDSAPVVLAYDLSMNRPNPPAAVSVEAL